MDVLRGKREFDVIVAGSGAGGLSAAVTAAKLGLDVVVVEKEPMFGGTTARSGGVLWIPGNPHSASLGIHDDIEGARAYVRALAGTAYDAARVDAFLRAGPKMVEFFERETAVAFAAQPEFPDYRADVAGAATGRSIVASPFDGRELGKLVRELRPPLREITFLGMMFNASQEVRHFFRATRSLTSAAHVVRRLMRHAFELARHGRAMRLTNGNALAARLARSCIDLHIPICVSTPLRSIAIEDGTVTGAVVDAGAQTVQLRARVGVVLACGGFPHDVERQRRLFPHVHRGGAHFSPGSPGNTGDALRAAMNIGGALAESLSSPAAWIPVSRVEHSDGTIGAFPHLIDRYKPGVIAIAPDGRRFVNEADSYHEFGKAMLALSAGASETCAWLLCDHRALRRYGLGYVKPFPVPYGSLIRRGYLVRGRTIGDLARAIGVDPRQLEATIGRFNFDAASGADCEFGKGSTPYNRFLGDPEHRPNPCVAPLETAPFYAIRLVMGDLGTFAGLSCDAEARVLDRAGVPIPGLYAAGNDMASIMGGAYPGGGITLGPAMTFGFIAAQSLARRAAQSTEAVDSLAQLMH
jgi:succinate dehydrogenase/fumarate reductase flavoprotein subunit